MSSSISSSVSAQTSAIQAALAQSQQLQQGGMALQLITNATQPAEATSGQAVVTTTGTSGTQVNVTA